MSEMGNNLKETSLAEMERILADQKKAYLDEGIVSTETVKWNTKIEAFIETTFPKLFRCYICKSRECTYLKAIVKCSSGFKGYSEILG